MRTFVLTRWKNFIRQHERDNHSIYAYCNGVNCSLLYFVSTCDSSPSARIKEELNGSKDVDIITL